MDKNSPLQGAAEALDQAIESMAEIQQIMNDSASLIRSWIADDNK